MATKKAMPSGAVSTKQVNLDDLELDPDNPRLPAGLERSQAKMLDYIAKSTDIEELMEVIGENGFFQGEALIAYPSSKVKGRLRVIEGNRRLTAVRLCPKHSAKCIDFN